MDNQAKPELTHTRESGLQFSTIRFEVHSKHFCTAVFFYGYSQDGSMIRGFQTTLVGSNVEDCIKRIERFLEIELQPGEYEK